MSVFLGKYLDHVPYSLAKNWLYLKSSNSIGKHRINKENHRAKMVYKRLVSCRETSLFGNIFHSQLPKITSVHLGI
jgi:hypothetical protein